MSIREKNFKGKKAMLKSGMFAFLMLKLVQFLRTWFRLMWNGDKSKNSERVFGYMDVKIAKNDNSSLSVKKEYKPDEKFFSE